MTTPVFQEDPAAVQALRSQPTLSSLQWEATQVDRSESLPRIAAASG